jgi:hypothetical protein
MGKMPRFFFVITILLLGFTSCNSLYLKNEHHTKYTKAYVERLCESTFVLNEPAVITNIWGSLNPPQNSEFVFVTNGDFSMENQLIREGEEFLGFVLEKIHVSVIETWGGYPGMNDPIHAVFSGGEIIATGDIVIELAHTESLGVSDVFIFSAHEPYFNLFPAVVGDMTFGLDVSFNIKNAHSIMNILNLVRPDTGIYRTIIEDITVRISEISLKGRRRDCVTHEAYVEVLFYIENNDTLVDNRVPSDWVDFVISYFCAINCGDITAFRELMLKNASDIQCVNNVVVLIVRYFSDIVGIDSYKIKDLFQLDNELLWDTSRMLLNDEFPLVERQNRMKVKEIALSGDVDSWIRVVVDYNGSEKIYFW